MSRETFWEMSPREFFCAWQGKLDHEKEKHEVIRFFIYDAARFNAASTAMSKEASREISKTKFPWEKGKKHKLHQPLDYDEMKGVFNKISVDKEPTDGKS